MLRVRESAGLAILLAVAVAAGCASERSAQRGLFPLDVKLSSEPPGAKIIARVMGGKQSGTLKVMGLTPHTLTIPAPVTVVLHKRGFGPLMVNLGSDKSVSVPLQQVERDSTYEEIWRKGTFRGEKISFQDDALKKRAYISDNPELPAGIKGAIDAGKLVQGMTMEQVLLVWGRPQGVITAEDSLGRHGKWLYEERELFFENGKLISWEE